MVSRASLRRNGPRSGLSNDDSSITVCFSGDFFFPELRSGDGLAREVDGEGDGGRRGTGEVSFGLMDSDRSVEGRIWWWLEFASSGTVMRSGGASGGVLTDTNPGMAAWENSSATNLVNLYLINEV